MTTRRFCRSFAKRSLLLIAPSNAQLQAFQGKITRSKHRHSALIAETQRLRGRVYSEDGAISESALTADGRHLSPIDDSSWHLLTVDGEDEVLGCMRFRQHHRSAKFHDLCLKDSSLAKCGVWGDKLKASVSADLSTAKRLGFQYVEVGGWALSHRIRGTSEALQSVLAIFAWSQAMGGALGVSTATERNGSASILKRLGGDCMHWDGSALPPYYDSHYQCGMEILRFDSRLPNPRYVSSIEDLRLKLGQIEIVQNAPEETVPSPKVPFFLPDLMSGTWAGLPSPA